jgi:tetratricopeptide (TPR) repeat protein
VSGVRGLGTAVLLGACICASSAAAEQPAQAKAAKVVKVDNVDGARTHFERGQAAYAEGRLKEALSELQRAYALAPSAELAYDLGRVCERLGEADLAIAYFGTYLERSGELEASERAALNKRINALRALQKRQRTPLLQPPPSGAALDAEARAFFARGIKLFAQGHYDAAIAAFEAARRNDALPELAYDMALTAERLGRLQDAIDYYREYLRKAQAPADADRVQAHIEALERRVLPDR